MIGKSNHRNQHGPFHLVSLHKSLDRKELRNIHQSISDQKYDELSETLLLKTLNRNSHNSSHQSLYSESIIEAEDSLNKAIKNFTQKQRETPPIRSSQQIDKKTKRNEKNLKNIPANPQIASNKAKSNVTSFQLSCSFFTNSRCSITNDTCTRSSSCLFYKAK